MPTDSPCGKVAVTLERTHDSSDALLGALRNGLEVDGPLYLRMPGLDE